MFGGSNERTLSARNASRNAQGDVNFVFFWEEFPEREMGQGSEAKGHQFDLTEPSYLFTSTRRFILSRGTVTVKISRVLIDKSHRTARSSTTAMDAKDLLSRFARWVLICRRGERRFLGVPVLNSEG